MGILDLTLPKVVTRSPNAPSPGWFKKTLRTQLEFSSRHASDECFKLSNVSGIHVGSPDFHCYLTVIRCPSSSPLGWYQRRISGELALPSQSSSNEATSPYDITGDRMGSNNKVLLFLGIKEASVSQTGSQNYKQGPTATRTPQNGEYQ